MNVCVCARACVHASLGVRCSIEGIGRCPAREVRSAPSLLTSVAASLSSLAMSPPLPVPVLSKLDDQEAALTCKDRLSIHVLVGVQHSLAVAAVTSTGVVKGGWR